MTDFLEVLRRHRLVERGFIRQYSPSELDAFLVDQLGDPDKVRRYGELATLEPSARTEQESQELAALARELSGPERDDDPVLLALRDLRRDLGEARGDLVNTRDELFRQNQALWAYLWDSITDADEKTHPWVSTALQLIREDPVQRMNLEARKALERYDHAEKNY